MNQRLTDIRRAQLDQLLSGDTHMAGGGLLKAVAKAAKPALKAVQDVLPLAEREANLAKFLAPSAEKRRMYHGSKEPNIKEFKTRKDLTDESHMTGHYADERDAVFLAPEPEFTKNFSQMGYTDTHQAPTTYPVYVQAENPFDFDNPEHLQRVKDTYLDMYHNPDSEFYDPYLSPSERSTSQHLFKKRVDELPTDENNWPRIENKEFQNVLKDLGFDSFYTRERGTKNLGVYDPNRIKSAIGNRGTYDLSSPDINEAKGGLVHLAGGGDPRKRGLFPKMSTQAIVDSPGFDPEVPSDLSRAYARRMAEKEAYQRSMADQKLTPAQRAVAGAEATGMLGSAMFEGVQQLPKLMDGEDAYTKAVGERMYQPRFQPEKAAEYAGNATDFLEKLETEYKMPQLLPELLPFAGAAEAAKQQAKKAVKQGALTAASRMDAGPKAGSMAAQRGVIKMPGGNFLTGRVEKDVAPLRSRGPTHRDEALMAGGRYAQEADTPEGIRAIAANAALNKWVDGNLSNYIKKQLGTPDDPVRALAEQGITHKSNLLNEYPRDQEALMQQRKAAGFPEEGMAQSDLAKAWERASDESISPHRAGDIQGMPEKFAKREEAERKMQNARSALDEKFMSHVENSGLSDYEQATLVSKTPYIDKARMIGDQDFLRANVEYQATHDPMMSSYIALGRENPWIAKVDPETKIYSSFTGDLGFDHIVDVLKQDVAEGRIRPEQLNKVSMEQAVRRTYEYDQEMAKKMAETQAKVTEGMPVHKEYPEGYKWIELAQPKDLTSLPEGHELVQAPNKNWAVKDKSGNFIDTDDGMYFGTAEEATANANKLRAHGMLKDALKYEGDTMGHCVGGYCPDVVAGRSRIYSLRDAKGEPHVTVEVKPLHRYSSDETDKLSNWFTSQPEALQDEITQEATAAHEAAKQANTSKENRYYWGMAMNDAIRNRMGEIPPNIVQIKGKGNRAPKEEYLPFVQDFVKGGNWSDVGDLQNTGLKDINANPNDLLPAHAEKYGLKLPRYLTENERSDLYKHWESQGKSEIPESLLKYSAPEEGMAGGGSVGLKNALNNLLRTDKPEVHMGIGGDVAKAALKAAKVTHPLVFPRAAAKSLEDIRPIAQRIAEQMTGDFVRQHPNPKVTTNPAGKSRKQFEREQNIPMETRNLVPPANVPVLDYEKKMGNVLLGVPGDPTLGGVLEAGSLENVAKPTVELTRVGDVTPEHPVPLFGGPRYGNDERFWASNYGAAVPIQNRADKLSDLYESPVLGQYIKMAPDSGNFALHNLDALLAIQQPEKLSKAKMEKLNREIKAGSPKYGKFPGFVGFEDPIDVLLQSQLDSNLRKHIAETLTKPTITDDLGLANGLDVVAAISHPELRNMEAGVSGFSIGELRPKSDLKMSLGEHPTYDTNIPGALIGQSKYPVPSEIAFPDTTAYARSRMTPGVQEFNMLKMLGPRERIDQQYIDEIKMYEELMKQYTGKKKGGLAQTKKVKRHGNTVPH